MYMKNKQWNVISIMNLLKFWHHLFVCVSSNENTANNTLNSFFYQKLPCVCHKWTNAYETHERTTPSAVIKMNKIKIIKTNKKKHNNTCILNTHPSIHTHTHTLAFCLFCCNIKINILIKTKNKQKINTLMLLC